MMHCGSGYGEVTAVITNLDHVVVLVRDLERAVAAYQTLFGRDPSWHAQSDGAATAIFTLNNMSVELMAPSGDGGIGDRVRAALDKDGEGLASFAFAVDDIGGMHRRLKRLGLAPDDVSDGESRDVASGKAMHWTRTRASTESTHGIRMFFIQRREMFAHSLAIAPSPIEALDHVVIATPDPDRAAALYGARLGLDMRLDRTNPDWGARLMFFRCGDLVVEIVHRLKEGKGDGPDKVWGLSWRVADIDATRARLHGAGLDVSDVRDGRKPGTRVLTVRDHTCGVPTLVIQQGTRPA